MWTVETVREQLPDVTVKDVDGTVYTGELVNRRLKYATVCIPELGVSYDYAWQTIVSCLNKDKPLSV